ncbi:hypothetical protein B0A48_09150 [Cryoendolithus antarcticus]|uniref:Bromo domain-containing protein n=1 Tax=Cryoendolithus antarcticus TaxID=1507870 RepID=A0A1V8T2J6_9PEZI|nr:hypothetical protein B0A48_09150 [Cryoendolithus antarcticus]
MAAAIQRKHEEHAADIQRKLGQEADLIAAREGFWTALDRCRIDKMDVAALCDEVEADFAAIQAAHLAKRTHLDAKLDAIQACRDEAEEDLKRTGYSASIDEGSESGDNIATAITPAGPKPRMPAHQKHFLLEALAALKRNDAYKAFRYPVTLSYDAPDYEDVVEQPMDLTTLAAKLLHDRYATVVEFMEDYNLIYSNSVLYYGAKNAITQAADKTNEQFTEYLRELPPAESVHESNVLAGNPNVDYEHATAVHSLPTVASRTEGVIDDLSGSKRRRGNLDPDRQDQKANKKRPADAELDGMTSGSVPVTEADGEGGQLASSGVVGSRKVPRRNYAILPPGFDNES